MSYREELLDELRDLHIAAADSDPGDAVSWAQDFLGRHSHFLAEEIRAANVAGPGVAVATRYSYRSLARRFAQVIDPDGAGRRCLYKEPHDTHYWYSGKVKYLCRTEEAN